MRFLIGVGAIRGLVDFVLNQAVRPGDADRIHRGVGPVSNTSGTPVIELLAVERAGLDLHLRVLGQFEALDALKLDADPAARGWAAAQAFDLAIGDAGAEGAP